MKKKVLAILLAVVMVMTLLPTVAFAAEQNVISTIDITVGNFTNPKSTIPEVKINGTDIANVPGLAVSSVISFNDTAGTTKYYCVNDEWYGSAPESQADLAGLELMMQLAIVDEEERKLDEAPNIFYKNSLAVTVNGETYSEITSADDMTSPGYIEINEGTNLWVMIPLKLDIPVTKITGKITPADFAYKMVIPSETTLTEANYKEGVLLGSGEKAGLVTIKVTKHDCASIDVYYTVDLTNGNLKDGSNHTITTNYGHSNAADGTFNELKKDTKYTVYTGGEEVATYIKVSADETSWNAAPVGDYNATVVFNFDSKEVCAVDLVEYPLLLRIVAIDDNGAHYAIYKYTDNAFVTQYSGMCDTDPLTDCEKDFGVGYAVGDYYHFKADFSSRIKCNEPEKHEITDIICSVNSSGATTYISVPVGGGYTYEGDNLTIGNLVVQGASEYTWTLDGNPLSASGTLEGGEVFVGTAKE